MYSRYCACCQELCACSTYFGVIIILFLGNGISLCWDRFALQSSILINRADEIELFRYCKLESGESWPQKCVCGLFGFLLRLLCPISMI